MEGKGKCLRHQFFPTNHKVEHNTKNCTEDCRRDWVSKDVQIQKKGESFLSKPLHICYLGP